MCGVENCREVKFNVFDILIVFDLIVVVKIFFSNLVL